jgi:hypothetical protein
MRKSRCKQDHSDLISPRPAEERMRIWSPDLPGWGLLDERTGRPVDPVALVTDEKIEMTAWERQDIAV